LSRLRHRAQAIELRAKDLEPVTSVGKAIQGFQMSEDAAVVRVLTGSR